MSETLDFTKIIPENDRDYLQSKRFEFKVMKEAGIMFLILNDFELSTAYNPSIADLLILIPAGFPNAQLDMFWTYPNVKLQNGSYPLAAEHHQIFLGINWQRWSRHFHWRMGIDSLKSFLAAIRKEINKGK